MLKSLNWKQDHRAAQYWCANSRAYFGGNMVFLKNLKVAAIAIAMSVLGMTTAQAVTVSVGPNSYNLTTEFTSYSAATATLQDQEWWGNASLAEDLAAASANVLPTQNSGYPYGGSNYGAFFAYKTYPNGGNLFVAIAVYNFTTGLVQIDDVSFQSTVAFLSSGARVLALETTPVPLPAALPLFMAGLGGLTFMRRRKS
jgi:hypothetical protein